MKIPRSAKALAFYRLECSHINKLTSETFQSIVSIESEVMLRGG